MLSGAVQVQIALKSIGVFRIVEILYNALSIRFPNVLLVDARQRLHGRTYHDPARHTRFFSAGGLHPSGCACLSRDAGSLILVQGQLRFNRRALRD